jgi:NitT/TauT family transport system ATP-binding protein
MYMTGIHESEEVDAERVLQDIAHALPHDNPEKVLETMIASGRYAAIMDYNPNSKTVFVPHDEENATK